MKRYDIDADRRVARRYDLGLVDRDFGVVHGYGADFHVRRGLGDYGPRVPGRTPQGYVVDPGPRARYGYDFTYRRGPGGYRRDYDGGLAIRAGRLDRGRRRAPLFRGWNNGYW
ncbi:MAG TPA: hypothetical protein VFL93_05415, partial [Longimicrobiaceae bacterium]|nr:hypothetical protein [Longimicrobiaceae bacterium]